MPLVTCTVKRMEERGGGGREANGVTYGMDGMEWQGSVVGEGGVGSYGVRERFARGGRYFFRKDESAQTSWPLARSLCRVLRYHLGTIAAGSLVVAIVRMLRLGLMLLDRATKIQQEPSSPPTLSLLIHKLTHQSSPCSLSNI